MRSRTHLSPVVAVLALILTAPPVPASEACVQDIRFLLEAIEAKAGTLLKQKGVDWPSIEAEFRAAAAAANTDEQHFSLIARLLSKLNDGHAGIIQSKIKLPDQAKGRRFTGPRVHLVVSGDKVYIRAAFKDAAEAGLKAGQEVLHIDGTAARDWLGHSVTAMQERGSSFSTPQQALYAACHWGLADWEGTPITFEIQDETGTAKTIRRVRNGGPNQVPFGPVFAPPNLKFVGRQSYGKTAAGLGYIHLRDIPGHLPAQLDEMLMALGEVPGLILDMRANGGGGCDHAAVFGRFLAKGQQWRSYQGVGDSPFTGPMVVIIDAGVRSAGETVAGMLKEDGRAYMIGDSPTAGTSSQKEEVTTPSGLFKVRFSVRTNMGRFNNGRGIEGIGVPPHELVAVRPQDLLQQRDTLIERATELLRTGLPKDSVPYAPAPALRKEGE